MMEEEIALRLLDIGAVSLSPRDPYTWASGVRSPIYCDCRRILSFVEARKVIEDAWAGLVREKWPRAEALVGVATGGVPHAAFVAERLNLPLAYVRSKPKGHGLEKRVEGFIPPGCRVVIMEDLVSTGASLLDAVHGVAAEGGQVIGASAIFTYELRVAEEAFRKEAVPLHTLTRLSAIRRVAERAGRLTPADVKLLDEGMVSVSEQLQNRGKA